MKCRVCGALIETDYGKDSLEIHTDTKGTKQDPHAPGGRDDICAPCNYSP